MIETSIRPNIGGRDCAPEHNWAHGFEPTYKYQDTDSRLSYHGSAAYSYRTVVGLRFIRSDGTIGYILDGGPCSSTTNRHISRFRRAIPDDTHLAWIRHARLHRTDSPAKSLDLAKEVKLTLKYIQQDVDEANKPRTKTEKWMGEAAIKARRLLNLLCVLEVDPAIFGITQDLDTLVAESANILAKQDELEAKRQAAAQAALAKKRATDILAWRAGGTADLHEIASTLLRLHPDGSGDLESSRGVRINRDEARLIWRAMVHCRLRGITLSEGLPSLEKTGFSINHISPTAIRAGCHLISFEEAVDLALRLDWVDTAKAKTLREQTITA